MNKIIIILCVIAAGYFFVTKTKRPNTTITFQEKTYERVKKKYGGLIQNYFYALKGEKFETANEFIHIMVLDKGASDKIYKTLVKQLKNSYRIKYLPDSDNELFGTKKAGPFEVVIYCIEFTFKGQITFALYMTLKDEDLSIDELRDGSDDIYNSLIDLQSTLK